MKRLEEGKTQILMKEYTLRSDKMALMNMILNYEFEVKDSELEMFKEWLNECNESEHMKKRAIDSVRVGKLETNTRYSRNKFRTGMKLWFKYVNEEKDGNINI